MFWQEDSSELEISVPDDVVDILFALDCKRLPVDHLHRLCAALHRSVPWIARSDSGIAVHSIHVAGSQNGWERPKPGADRYLMLSKRTKLILRVPKEHTHELIADLRGKVLDLGGCLLKIGAGKIRPLSQETTLFARYLVGPHQAAVATPVTQDPEEEFLRWALRELEAMDIRAPKALCGKTTSLYTPAGPLRARSLMLAGLSPRESIRLQQRGLGTHRQMGCGIFIPHKGIEPVAKGH